MQILRNVTLAFVDTDDLPSEAYKGIIIGAEKFDHD